MWLVYAFLAATIWGLDYVLGEKIFKYRISPVTLLTLQMFIGVIIFFIAGYRMQLKQELALILSNRTLLWITVAAILSFNLGNLFIFLSIRAKNATLAALIELSYPIFTMVFAWLLFQENHVTISVTIGSILIFAGIVVIALFN